MKTKHFLNQIDHDRVVAAIVEAEKRTSGEIRVHVSHRKVNDALNAAAVRFFKLRMHETKERNAVLLFVSPESQTFSIIGDQGVHARCGDEFWQRVAAEMSQHFKQQKFSDGIVHGIQSAGKLLAEHFPHQRPDVNELPNAVTED